MLVVHDQVWCGFLKSGVRVYHADSHKCIATAAHDRTVNQLLYSTDLRVVYAFTHEGDVMSFGDLAGLSNQAELNGRPVTLPSKGVTPIEKRPPLECAVLVPCKDGPVIWCYAQTIRQLIFLDHITLEVKGTLSVPGRNTQKRAVQPTSKMISIKAEANELVHGEELSSSVLLLEHMRVQKFCTKTVSFVTVTDMQDCLVQGMPAGEEG